MNEFISVSEAAAKWGVSHRRVQILCNQGRIEGAMRIGTVWIIPAKTSKPVDARLKEK